MFKKHRVVTLVLCLALAFGPAVAFAEESRFTSEQSLEDIRTRIRAEAGLSSVVEVQPQAGEPAPVACESDMPMVEITALGGDTAEKLAIELTGTRDATRINLASAPEIGPGTKVMLPRTLLRPTLADADMATFTLGQDGKTIREILAANLKTDGVDIGIASRNIQRLNGISDASKLPVGQEIAIPRAMMKKSLYVAAPAEISDAYRANVYRKATVKKVVNTKKGKRAKKVRVTRALDKRSRDIDLVVIHTTEHSGTTLQSTASYIQRNHLAHYVIGPKGEIYRVVPEEYRAHGAGEAIWNGTRDVDARAINIEIFADTADTMKYSGISDAQYAGLRSLLDDIRMRRPEVHAGRIVTHSMVAMSFKYKTRSRKGDPYVFDWAKAGLPNNSLAIDQDVLLGRVRLCEDKRYADRVTPGQEAAARFINKM